MVWVLIHANCTQMPGAAHPGCLESEEHSVPSFKVCAEHRQKGNGLLGCEVLSLCWFEYIFPPPLIRGRHERKVSCDLSGIMHPQKKGAKKSRLLNHLRRFQRGLCGWIFCEWGECMPDSSQKKARKASGLGTEKFWEKSLMEGCGNRDAVPGMLFLESLSWVGKS